MFRLRPELEPTAGPGDNGSQRDERRVANRGDQRIVKRRPGAGQKPRARRRLARYAS